MFESGRGLFYSWWVRSKHFLQWLVRAEDTKIGLEYEVADKSVIDVGCGPNLDIAQTEYPHKTCSAYLGVDNSLEFIISANAIHKSNRHLFLRAEASNLPFADDSFDVGTLLFTLHHVQASPTKVLMEIS